MNEFQTNAVAKVQMLLVDNHHGSVGDAEEGLTRFEVSDYLGLRLGLADFALAHLRVRGIVKAHYDDSAEAKYKLTPHGVAVCTGALGDD